MTLDPEIQELLDLVEQPDPPRPLRAMRDIEMVRHFVQDNDLRPGRTPGVQMVTLFHFYRDWLSRMVPPVEPMPPKAFAFHVKACGFLKKYRYERGGLDMRLIGMHPATTMRLRSWSLQNPDSQADFDLFRVRRKQGAE